jgi:hypothetical protein
MFDSRQYEWADITLVLGGRDVTGVRGVKYTTKQEKELCYGKGNLPLSIQKGNKSYEGEITMLQSELEALRLAGGGSILDMQINAIVTYGLGEVLVTDEIIGIQFTDETKEMKQGDKFMEITLPIVFLRLRKLV